jgi:hypothetical protein
VVAKFVASPVGEVDGELESDNDGSGVNADDSDADGESDAYPDPVMETDVEALSEAIFDDVADDVALAERDAQLAVAEGEDSSDTDARYDGVIEEDGYDVAVGMTRFWRPTPRNSRPSFAFVLIVDTVENANRSGSSR